MNTAELAPFHPENLKPKDPLTSADNSVNGLQAQTNNPTLPLYDSATSFIDLTEKTVDDLSHDPKTTAFKRLHKKLRRQVGYAIRDYKMIEEGDRVMVCISGGKDSFTMLDILLSMQKNSPIKFEIVAVNLDQKQPNFPEHILPEYLTAQGIPHYILEKDTYSIVKRLTPEGSPYCAVCSRLRRGSLYGFAEEIGATKIALGHHRDDMMATFFLNLFHGGTLKSMPPKLLSDDGRNMVIRPLAYVAEKDIIKYAKARNFPIIPCDLCGSQSNLQRAQMNEMLRDWDQKYPKRLASIFSALQNVAPSQLLDRELFDFEQLKRTPAATISPEEMQNRLQVLNIQLD